MKSAISKPVLALVLSLFFSQSSWTQAAETMELRDGDRVVLLGDALIEQEQYAGWIEVMMTTAHPDRNTTFRNLGWNGDTPAGDSRFGLSLLQAGQEPDDEGWKQLVKQLELTKPTVLVVGYGMANSLEDGQRGFESFSQNFQRLIDTTRKISPGVRFVLLSPISRVDESPQASDHSAKHHQSAQQHRDRLIGYRDAIESLAKSNDSLFIDLTGVATDPAHRKNPVHLNDAGYREVARAIGEQLGWAQSWIDSDQTEALRQVILRKNVWWFHRSRPANMAYVFGFRKREQGQNAIEIPKFDELIAEEERSIALLRSLHKVDVETKPERTQSQYAKFTQQPTPEFTVAEDLEVTLWAENPQLNKPIQMNFDPQGRLWVASSEAYPMIEVGQAAPDQILVLEDTNGDGRADKSTVFADGLLIPTGVQPGNGGCYVAQSTDLLFLKDADGDGKADVKERVLSGFGTEDTHHNLHTLTWGPDGRLYMNQAIYTRSDVETPHDVVRLKAGGGFRFNPATKRMQIFFRGMWNPWGHQFDQYGRSFLTDGAGFAGVAYAFPGAAFNPTPNASRVLDLISPGPYPKFASAEIISGQSYPPAWQGSLVTCDFRANRVTRFSIEDQDAGFVTKQEDDLMRSSSSTFRPIDVKQGPDGALYVADWSNPIINHGEVDFRDERRDRWHGRIWRVTWKGAKTKPTEDLTRLNNRTLLTRLTSDDRYTRDQARRVLVERGDKISDDVHQWILQTDNEQNKLQGVWLQQAIGRVMPKDLGAVLSSNNPNVRAAAIRIVNDLANPETDQLQPLDVDSAIKLLTDAVNDDHPRVRLEAIRALGSLGTTAAAAGALQAINHPRDRFIDFALATTLDELTEPFMVSLESGAWTFDTPVAQKQLEFALTSIEPARAASFLSKQLASNAIPADGSGPWIELIGKAGGVAELTKLFDQVIAGGLEPAAMTRAVNAISEAQRLRKQQPAGDLRRIGKLFRSENESLAIAAIRLAGNWRMGAQVEALTDVAKNAKPKILRETATQALREIGIPAVSALGELAQSEDKSIRVSSVIALASLDAYRAAKPFYRLLAETESEKDALTLWRGVLTSRTSADALARNLPSDGISEHAARAGLTAARDGGRKEPKLVAAITPHANITMKAEDLTPERMSELINLVQTEGDPVRGESIYNRAELQCINCHAIGGAGGKVGPDMTSLGASAPIDYLIESIYLPNAKIKENYHSVSVLTFDGQIVNGIVVDSNNDELVLRNVSNELVRIPQDDIEFQKAGQSLMPQGVVDRLSPAEQVDLISFLTQLGRPGEFDASQGGVARQYDVLAGTHRIEQGGGSERIISGQISEGWTPLMSRVNGMVPSSTLTEMTKQQINIALIHVYLRTKIQVSNDGEVTLHAEGGKPVALWIDGETVEGTTTFTTQLSAGEYTVLVRLDARDLPKHFRLTSDDATFATQ